MSFNTPNYRIVQRYINNKLNNNIPPENLPFDNAIAQSVKFDDDNLRGNMNQLRQELHNIVHQANYVNYDDNSLNKSIEEQDIKVLNNINENNQQNKISSSGYYSSNNPIENYVPMYNNQRVNSPAMNNLDYISIIDKLNEINNLMDNINDIKYDKKLRKLSEKDIAEINKTQRKISQLKQQINNSNLYRITDKENFDNEIAYVNNSKYNIILYIIIAIFILVSLYIFFNVFVLCKSHKNIEQKDNLLMEQANV